jgi:glycosyltransferase involved in cell wall biosynthesis
MAAGKPIVAARAAAATEVVWKGVLVEPDNAGALADGIWWLWRDPSLRSKIQQEQRKAVEEYEMIRVSKRFMGEVARVTHIAN